MTEQVKLWIVYSMTIPEAEAKLAVIWKDLIELENVFKRENCLSYGSKVDRRSLFALIDQKRRLLQAGLIAVGKARTATVEVSTQMEVLYDAMSFYQQIITHQYGKTSDFINPATQNDMIKETQETINTLKVKKVEIEKITEVEWKL